MGLVAESFVVDSGIIWYQTHKRWARRLFRVSGVGILLLSSSLPLIALSSSSGARVVVAVIGAAVAILTSLNGFFRWERSWHAYSSAQLDLEYHWQVWQLKMAAARSGKTEEETLELARKATKELLDSARRAIGQETTEHFKSLIVHKH